MKIETNEGYQSITLQSGKTYDVTGLETPDYGVDAEGNSYIFDNVDREEIASHMIKLWLEYSQEKTPVQDS